MFTATWRVSAFLTSCCTSICPSVITFVEPTMNGGFLYQWGKTSKVI